MKLSLLSENSISMIHEASLNILEERGVLVENDELLKIAKHCGSIVDENEKQIRFPSAVVQKFLNMTPRLIQVQSRDGDYKLELNNDICYNVAGHQAVFIVDPQTGKKRTATYQDAVEFSIVANLLPHIHMIATPLIPSDVPSKAAVLYSAKAVMEHSTKPLVYASDDPDIHLSIISMTKACNVPDGYLICEVSPTSPLSWKKDSAESLLVVAKSGQIVDIIPAPIAGVTAPYTLAGQLALHTAEALSGIVLTQMINPGVPVIFCGAWTTYEMKKMSALIGRPESAMLRVAGAQMANFYGIPSHVIGPDSDALIMDEQCGWEKMLSLLSGILSGNSMIVNSGMFATGMSACIEQLVLDDEMFKIASRFTSGFEVSDETIATELIKDVGYGGNYLAEEHTLEYLHRGEHVQLDISCSESYEAWLATGGKTLIERARNKADELLSQAPDTTLSMQKRAVIDAIIEQFVNKVK